MKIPSKSCELAEFIGILLGDGCVNKDGFINVTTDDEFYAKNHVLKLFNDLFGIGHFYRHPKGFFRVQTKSKPMMNFLIYLGLEYGNKLTNGVSIPDWILKNNDFLRYCLRGFFDSDGSIFKHYKWSSIYFEFKCKSKSIIISLYAGLKLLGFELTKLEGDRFYIKQRHNRKFINEIGFSHPKHLNRLVKFQSLIPL